jgi:hypothetical protein
MAEKNDDAKRQSRPEAEVVRLHDRQGQPVGAGSSEPDSLGRVSRGKVIGLAIAIALIALVAFAGIFFALSSGFDSLAKKAAKSLVPEGPGSGSGSSKPPPAQGPSAPGL